MNKVHALVVSLEEFGLSRYESLAYVTLISKGTISASEVAYYSELPRTKVYPILLKLEKKKLAIISKSKPIMCTAIAPEDAFDGIVHEQINKVNAMNMLVDNLKQVNEESKKSRGSEEKRYFHINANNVLEQLRLMIEGSKSSIHIIADSVGLNLLTECKKEFLTALRKNVEVKMIIPSTQIGSDSFHIIPESVKIRMRDTAQNCLIFDETEVFLIDSNNGKGAIFSATEVLGSSQTRMFAHMWTNSLKTESLYNMTKKEAQDVCKIINLINENGLGHILNSRLETENLELGWLKFLESYGINLKSKSLEDIIDFINATLQITCVGHVNYDKSSNNITIESKLNSGHSLPWSTILNDYLLQQGYQTKLIFQSQSQKGEKIYIKINSNKN